ncbi:MAG TPA: CpaD family pilus assembly protein [Rhizomicrobium sp.]|nr:CpaD family pilus assembly protein [Rhizomicrobium sp.]
MKLDALFRTAAVLSMLVAGSCSVANDGATISEDGARNHPIMVEPSYRELKVQFAGETEGMNPEDAVKFDAFVADYRAHGNGSLGISVPDGAASRAAITFFAERAAASGISRDKILVSTHGASSGDYRVDISYIAYSAHADSCGDWSENLAFTAENQTMPNFGCAVQHNIAAMIADPRDLVSPRPFDTADGNRAATVIDNYEQGKPTAAQKTQDQSAAVSDVNK